MNIVILATLAALSFQGSVTSITDGDTFVVSDEIKVRIWGLDVDDDNPKQMDYARQVLTELIAGKAVYCEHKGNSYQRLVARCFVGGEDIARIMIDRGAGTEWCKYSKGYYGTC